MSWLSQLLHGAKKVSVQFTDADIDLALRALAGRATTHDLLCKAIALAFPNRTAAQVEMIALGAEDIERGFTHKSEVAQ